MTKSSLIASVALLLAIAAAEPAVAIRIGGDLGKIIKKGEDTVKDAGKGAETIVKNVGKETERAAKDVGNGLKRLPEEAEKTVKNLKKAVPKEVRNAVDKTYKGAVAVTVGSVVATSVVPLQASSEAGKALIGKQSFSDAWNKSSAAAKESIATQAAGTSMMVQGAAGVGEAGNAAIEHMAGEICDECKDAATAYLAPNASQQRLE